MHGEVWLVVWYLFAASTQAARLPPPIVVHQDENLVLVDANLDKPSEDSYHHFVQDVIQDEEPRIEEKTWFEGDPVVIDTINLEHLGQDEDYHKAEINQVNNDEEYIEDIPLAINIYVGNEDNEEHEEAVQQNVFDQEEVDTPKERIVLESLDIIGEPSHDDGILESVSVDITGEQSDFIYENLEDASDTDNKGFTVEQTFEEDPNYAGTYSPVDKHEEQETVERVGYPDNIELVGFDKKLIDIETSPIQVDKPVAVETVVVEQDNYVPHEHLDKAGDKDCYPQERTVFTDEMVEYMEETCITRQQSQCKEIEQLNCVGKVETMEKRVCFNVTETVCQMEESIEFEPLDPGLQQLCKDEEKLVCDTIYKMETTPSSEHNCIDVENLECRQERPFVSDLTCVKSFLFDCSGSPEGSCLKTPTKKCYTTPRRIEVDVCEPVFSQVCKKLSTTEEKPVPNQHCHPYTKKLCKLVPRPENAKKRRDPTRKPRELKFIYKEKCTNIQKEMCGTWRSERLVPSCSPASQLICTDQPTQTCSKTPKKYKLSREKLVVEMVCADKKVNLVDQSVEFI